MINGINCHLLKKQPPADQQKYRKGIRYYFSSVKNMYRKTTVSCQMEIAV